MATLFEFEGEQLADWNAWLADRPQVIKDLAARLPPNKLYLLKSSNHRVTLVSYSEDGTVKVAVTGDYNCISFNRHVFGIKPEDLEECDLPPEGALLGEMFTEQEDVDAVIGMQIADLHVAGKKHNEERCPVCLAHEPG